MIKKINRLSTLLKNRIFYFSLILSLLIVNPTPVKTANNKSQIKDLQRKSTSLWVQGDISEAINIWEQESQIYQQNNQINQEFKTILKIAEGYTKLGDISQAINKVNEALDLKINDATLSARALEMLGNLLSMSGKHFQAIHSYKMSLRYQESLSCINNLVKTEKVLIKQIESYLDEAEKKETKKKYNSLRAKYKQEALEYAEKAKNLSKSELSLSAAYALINWASLFDKRLTDNQVSQITQILNSQSPSRSLVFTMINWSKIEQNDSFFWLLKAKNKAQEIGDPLAQSDALLHLSYFFETRGNLSQALEYSHQSQLIAQSNFLYDILYRSQWLAGRIYRRQHQLQSSLISYQNAIASLEILKRNTNHEQTAQSINFPTEIEPVYRELINLLLDRNRVSAENINQALLIADKLKLSELQNFFGDDCFQIARSGQTVENKQAVFSSIILEDKTFVVLQLPNGSTHLNKIDISRSELQNLSLQWRKNLIQVDTWDYQVQGKRLYDLLLRPFEQKLAQSNFEVLVFVHDGILRNLPMSALFDGEKFLAEKWASVSSIGVNFTPRITNPSQSNALFFGLSSPTQPGWSTLNKVFEEIDSVHKLIGGQKYLDSEFSLSRLTEQLEKNVYSIVHLATHGYFAGNPEDSFILAHDGKISILDLEQYLSNQTVIELLVLSACETSVVSNRSLLGLAGVAARSGVQSTLGSLWQVQDDEQSYLIQEFYSYWQLENFTKATALQKVQQEQISQFAHPKKWAALNLIGDYR